jgi:hypothetical protein
MWEVCWARLAVFEEFMLVCGGQLLSDLALVPLQGVGSV